MTKVIINNKGKVTKISLILKTGINLAGIKVL